jgi:exonuclease SbcC
MKVEVEDLFNTEPSSKNEAQVIILKNRINSAKKGVDNNKIHLYFSDIFLKFFNEKVDLVKGIDVTNFEKKRSYLNWKYAIYQSNTIKKKKEDYEAQKIRFDNAGKLKSRVDELREVYRESLKEYEKELIGDIEILFHIYSGRIIQDYQGGLGLFIFDKNGIRFLEDPERSHDAVFSMSSGQISALIIAFTLTLNKKYSQNKVLFIDDPVQTLDELNIAGLVELLRNEFSDRQIFLSTHEDKISAYIRYKFDKFKLKTQRVSFKEKYFESAPL